MGDHEGILKIEYDDITMKTKLTLLRFGGSFGALRLDEKSFFIPSLGFTPFWAYKPNNVFHADSPGVYSGEKNLNLF